MKILSIDTSTMISSCTVMDNGIILGDYNVNQELTHSETLVPMIDDLLEKLNIKISEIDLYAVGKGPGSFTGLRIGMTVAKTFAQIFNKEIIGISTLEALASQLITDKKIIPILDARGGRAYYGIYENCMGNVKSIEKDDLIYFDELIEIIKDRKEEFIFVGELNEDFIDQIKGLKNGYIAPASLNSCIGRALCNIAKDLNNKKRDDNYLNLKPEYIRKSQAERDLELREKNV